MPMATKDDGVRSGRRVDRPGNRIWFLGAVGVVLLALGVFLLRDFGTERVRNYAMAPAVTVNQLLLIDKSAAGRANRGDIVLVDRAGWAGESGQSLLRVVAVAGDTVTCCGSAGQIEVNGRPVAQDTKFDQGAAAQAFTAQVPAGRVFLLGDRRGIARDSAAFTAANGGTVPVSAVRGSAVAVLLPFGAAKSIAGQGAPTGALAGGVVVLHGLVLLLAAIVVGVRRRFRRPLPDGPRPPAA